MSKSKTDLNKDTIVWGKEAAAILGISKQTFDHRRIAGEYNGVRKLRLRLGYKYSIFDIFRIAHPRASDDKIEEFIRNYKDKQIERSQQLRQKLSKSQRLRHKQTRDFEQMIQMLEWSSKIDEAKKIAK